MFTPGQEVYHVDTFRTGTVVSKAPVYKDNKIVESLTKVLEKGLITRIRWDDTREIELVNTSDLQGMELELVLE